ncbi:MAG: glycosyltransferase family 4 protein [Aeromicrobium sp.]
MAIYEFANGMHRRGHSVHVMHIGRDDPIGSLDDLAWMRFEDGIEHMFPGKQRTPHVNIPANGDGDRLSVDQYGFAFLANDLPEADFIAGYSDQIPSRHGLPFVFVQGYRTFMPAIEDALFRVPCPKVCIARWLVDVGRQKGVPADELVHIPNGLKHEKYRLVSPIENRPPLVSTRYRSHSQTGPAESLAVLAEVKRRVPEVEAIVFSTEPPAHETAPWIKVVIDPSQDLIVNEIYNRSRIFLCSSPIEGFGFPCIEAMACGAALVTTSNGGSDDYAIHGETALVCDPGDTTAMADNIERLLHDDELRIRLAKQGREYVRRTFDWDVSAERLETFLNEYAANPGRYLHR